MQKKNPDISGIIIKGYRGFLLIASPPGMSLDDHENILKKKSEQQKKLNLPPEAAIEVYDRFTGTLPEWREKKKELDKKYALPGLCSNCSLL